MRPQNLLKSAAQTPQEDQEMKIVQLLEQLAIHAPHHMKISELINQQDPELKEALLNSNTTYLKKQFTTKACLADETTVVQI